MKRNRLLCWASFLSPDTSINRRLARFFRHRERKLQSNRSLSLFFPSKNFLRFSSQSRFETQISRSLFGTLAKKKAIKALYLDSLLKIKRMRELAAIIVIILISVSATMANKKLDLDLYGESKCVMCARKFLILNLPIVKLT